MFTFFSPAKVNLFFRVLGKRKDGFHEIATLMVAIALYDKLTFSLADLFSLESNCDILSCDESNLIVKAAHNFHEATSIKPKVNIRLDKQIPMGAGLGGGSSNAATTLFALNQIYDEPLKINELSEIAAQLGSDIPFFLSSGVAYASGRGENVKELDLSGLPLKLWLVLPKIHCSTPKVYKECRAGEMSLESPEQLLNSLTFVNDLQPAAMRVYPELQDYFDQALQEFEEVFLTGSGAALVCLNPKNDYSIEKMGAIEAKLIDRKTNNWWSK